MTYGGECETDQLFQLVKHVKFLCNALAYSMLFSVYPNSASSGGGVGRGAPQHYPKTVGNR